MVMGFVLIGAAAFSNEMPWTEQRSRKESAKTPVTATN